MTAAAERASLKVLVADDHPDVRAMFVRALSGRGHACTPVAGAEAAMAALGAEPFDLMFVDLELSSADGMALLNQAFRAEPPPLVVVMTRYAALEQALKAIRAGAHDYIAKPFTAEELAVLIDNASAFLNLQREHDVLVRELADAYRVIAELAEVDHRASSGDVAPDGAAEAALDGSEEAEPEQGDAPPARQISASPRMSADAIAAYRAVAWEPGRSGRRLWTMLQQGTITREEYDRLSALIPHDLPTV